MRPFAGDPECLIAGLPDVSHEFWVADVYPREAVHARFSESDACTWRTVRGRALRPAISSFLLFVLQI